jgi:hypothetical protein
MVTPSRMYRRAPALPTTAQLRNRYAASTRAPELGSSRYPLADGNACRTMKKLRIVILGFGTARQKRVLE